MQTKTIRFEKGKYYTRQYALAYINEELFIRSFKSLGGDYKCLNSFTVQINIIEDDPELAQEECNHSYTIQTKYSCSVGDKCAICGVII